MFSINLQPSFSFPFFLFFKTQAEIDAARKKEVNPKRNFNFDPKLLLSLLLIIAGPILYYLSKEETVHEESMVIRTNNFGNVEIFDLTTFQTRDMALFLNELKETNPALFTEDDLAKIAQFLNWHLCSPDLLSWAISLLDRLLEGPLKEQVRRKICEIDPSFCGMVRVDRELKGFLSNGLMNGETGTFEIEMSNRLHHILEENNIKKIKDIEKFINEKGKEHWTSRFANLRKVGNKTCKEFERIVNKLLEYKLIRYY